MRARQAATAGSLTELCPATRVDGAARGRAKLATPCSVACEPVTVSDAASAIATRTSPPFWTAVRSSGWRPVSRPNWVIWVVAHRMAGRPGPVICWVRLRGTRRGGGTAEVVVGAAASFRPCGAWWSHWYMPRRPCGPAAGPAHPESGVFNGKNHRPSLDSPVTGALRLGPAAGDRRPRGTVTEITLMTSKAATALPLGLADSIGNRRGML
jgi:hypothetical protein